MKKIRILVDKDCVLADFVGRTASLWGRTFADLKPHWPAGHYGMEYVLARALGWYDTTPAGQDAPTFAGRMWERIGEDVGFWARLPVLPWANELMDLVRSRTDDWWIVTSPSRCPRCIPEKQEWCRRFFGVPYFDRMIPTGYKHLLANPNTVLIDDYDRNVESFRNEGGRALLFPAWHNLHHDLAGDPMAAVRPLLKTL